MDNRFSSPDSQIAKLTQERDQAQSNFAIAQKDAQVLNTALSKGLSIEDAVQYTEQQANFSGFDGGVSPSAHPAQQGASQSADQALRAAAGY
jgi:hypothetical protein